MAFCTNCGTSLSDGARFCGNCGAMAAAAGAATAVAPPVEPLEYTIQGDNLQVARIRLKPGQEVYAEAGKMPLCYRTQTCERRVRMIPVAHAIRAHPR